ncbi:hypothetical protein [Frankia sp. KB5]|uniref:hypothetical protein n=2 Tax=unclassified Frankia TaxID=2632575 RepID=UPI001F539D7C|nr:hypothetical protein [Frankia sp. KB5]
MTARATRTRAMTARATRTRATRTRAMTARAMTARATRTRAMTIPRAPATSGIRDPQTASPLPALRA